MVTSVTGSAGAGLVTTTPPLISADAAGELTRYAGGDGKLGGRVPAGGKP